MRTFNWAGWTVVLSLGLGVSAWGAEAMQLVSGRSAAMPPVAPGNRDSGVPLLSPDGRYVVFASAADDLMLMTNGSRMPAQIPPGLNVYLRDRTNGNTTLVSANLTGTNGGNGNSLPSGLSPDGRYVVFESSASDLVAGDTNGVTDVFVRDLVAGTTMAVSVSTNGDPGNGASRTAVMTPDGRYVAFVSAANNLVAGDTNGIADVFVRDLQSGTTTLLSVGATLVSSATLYGSSDAPAITPDGRYVAFYSTATNQVPGGTNASEIYVRDVVAGTTILASGYARTVLPRVWQGLTTCVSFGHAISADGQFVTYVATQNYYPTAPQVPITAGPGWGVILRYSLWSGLTDIISSNAAVPVVAAEAARNPLMSPDGRFVAYVANVVVGTTTNSCIQVWDAQVGSNVVASVDLSGATPTTAICDWPAITPDGRYVAFISNGTNFVTNVLSGDFHLYLRDLQAAATLLVDAGTNSAGAGVASTTPARLSDDGQLMAFEAPDGGLVAQDLNHAEDVFVRDVVGGVTELVQQETLRLCRRTPEV